MNQLAKLDVIARTRTETSKQSISCMDCLLKGNCFPVDIGAPKVDDFNAIVQRARPLHKGDHLYRAGQPFTTIYAVRSGAFKAYSISPDGEEQVMQFHLPGEIFGMDGISRNRHAVSVVALETSAVCAMPFGHLQALSARMRTLQRHLFRLMSEVILREQQLITHLSKYPAERRVAAFLRQLSEHQASRRQSATRLRLPMTRTDISSHLGLTVETVSRIFSRFQKIGLMTADIREVEILRPDWLDECAEGHTRAGDPGTVSSCAASHRRSDQMRG